VGRKKAISDAALALYNRLQREKFRSIPFEKRMLFLPHCLRKPQGCRADNTADGLVCKHCSPDCAVNQLASYASKKGYRCFVVPGGEMLFNIVEREKPGAILGVACHHEMAQAADRLGGEESTVSFAYQGVPLSKSGCVDTKVDLVAVKNVLDLEGPPPGSLPATAAASVFSPARRRTFARVGGVAAAVTVALAAMFLLMPGLLAPHISAPGHAEPALSFYSNPSVQYTKDETGTWALVKVSVRNSGDAPADGVVVQATAWWCGNPFEQKNGGQQMAAVNGSIAPGGKADLTLPVKVHSQNDTSIAVETLLGGKVAASKLIKTPRQVYLINTGATIETILGVKSANVTVWVYNEGSTRTPGTLRVVASSYSFGTRWDDEIIELDRPLAQGETWQFTVQLKVSGADPGRPSFAIELFEGQDSNPSDTNYFTG
jgi:hypothetical protein